MILLPKNNQLMKINYMSVWITENSNFLSCDDVIANEQYSHFRCANVSRLIIIRSLTNQENQYLTVRQTYQSDAMFHLIEKFKISKERKDLIIS